MHGAAAQQLQCWPKQHQEGRQVCQFNSHMAASCAGMNADTPTNHKRHASWWLQANRFHCSLQWTCVAYELQVIA
jgi:hypothetical protein